MTQSKGFAKNARRVSGAAELLSVKLRTRELCTRQPVVQGDAKKKKARQGRAF
jgi:hypothetical protein